MPRAILENSRSRKGTVDWQLVAVTRSSGEKEVQRMDAKDLGQTTTSEGRKKCRWVWRQLRTGVKLLQAKTGAWQETFLSWDSGSAVVWEWPTAVGAENAPTKTFQSRVSHRHEMEARMKIEDPPMHTREVIAEPLQIRPTAITSTSHTEQPRDEGDMTRTATLTDSCGHHCASAVTGGLSLEYPYSITYG